MCWSRDMEKGDQAWSGGAYIVLDKGHGYKGVKAVGKREARIMKNGLAA